MRRAIGILLLTGVLLMWPLAASAGDLQSTGTTASRADFNGDGADDLAVAAPGENNFAGVVHVLYGSGGGLSATGSQLWSQDSPGIAGVAESADFFGDARPPGASAPVTPARPTQLRRPLPNGARQRLKGDPESRGSAPRNRSPLVPGR
jgi:FG-GAP repeat protein